MGTHKAKPEQNDQHPVSQEQQPPAQATETESLQLSEEAAQLVAKLEAERDEALAARQRALADFVNFQRRSVENERRAGEQGATRIVRSILPVLDNFDLALNQNPSELTVEQLLGGVKIVRDELHKALQNNGVQRIDPAPGDEFDPNYHEAMMRQPAADIPPNHIVMVMQPGYVMGEHILRPAKVAISPPAEDE